MPETNPDLLGMERAGEYLIENPNAIFIPFTTDAANGFLGLYLATLPEEDRVQESMRLDKMLEGIRLAEERESVVEINRIDYEIVKDALLAEKARRDQLAFFR